MAANTSTVTMIAIITVLSIQQGFPASSGNKQARAARPKNTRLPRLFDIHPVLGVSRDGAAMIAEALSIKDSSGSPTDMTARSL
jgi:hypothetical protein